ncbi:MAG: type II toxin-antitoxin system VapC family toxin [Planctomycetia bacterium]|nr:type II toxin-antitoxin system VapC family toxin [Planctomycetia bacterium]
MKYLLDTNMCVFALRNKPRAVGDRIQQHKPDDIVISAITVAEFRVGADKSNRPEENHRQISDFLLTFDVLMFDSGAADAYGVIRADLERRGQPIGELDMLLAAHAVSQNLIFVTHNTSEFQRVKGLQLEDWFA